MADREDLSEAYHVWSHLQGQNDQDTKDLQDLRDQANQRLVALQKQLEEAEQHGDQAAVQRVKDGIEDAQQAWLTATHELGETDKQDDQPQEDEGGNDQDEVDGKGAAAASGEVSDAERAEAGASERDRGGTAEPPSAGGAVGEPAADDGE